MSKKLYFLMCFVLVVGLGSLAQADAIEVNNPSFEYDVNGNQIYCHAGLDTVKGWHADGTAYVGVDPYCLGDVNYDPCATPENICLSEECYTDDHSGCHCWPATHGIVYCYLQATKPSAASTTYLYQNLDGNDSNAVIAVGRKYILTWDAMSEIYGGSLDTAYSIASFYYGDEPTADVNVVATVSYPLPVWVGDLNEWEHEWEPDLTLKWVATVGHPALGKTLGLRWFSPSPGGPVRAYTTTENVRLEWIWATSAYDPVPEDGAEDVARDVNLSWSPGFWADDTNGHHVYFGTSFADVESRNGNVYFGVQSPNSFDPTPGANQLDLVQTYYWAIDEVNDTWPGIPGVPDPTWLGDVWSFEVAGYATNPKPEDGAKNVSMYTDLSWTPGTDSNSHDVYFGTDLQNVTDANQLSSEYMSRQDANDFNDFVPALELGKKYYWRIDEVNEASGTLVKGKVWGFTVANYLVVDDFDSYADDAAIKAVWKDYWSDPLLKNGAEVFRETDVNLVHDGNSMRFAYRNYNTIGPNYVGSEAEASIADLEIGPDWTTGGVKALVLYFFGDAGNGQDHAYPITVDQMYVAVEDGDGNVGIVLYPDMNDIKEDSLHEWNIELADPCLADVNMANIAKVYIGFGGTERTGQSEAGAGKDTTLRDTVWFDDIRLYPPRCRPEIAYLEGSFDYDDNCVINYGDVYTLGGYDWLASGIGMVNATAPSDANLVGHWALDDDAKNSDVLDSSVNNNDGVLYDDVFKDEPKLGNTDAHHTDANVEGTGALEFDGYDDFVEIPALDLNSNTVTISAWIKRDGAQPMYAGIVACHYDPNDPCDPNAPGTGAGLDFGSGGTYGFMDWGQWEINHELCYFWSADMSGWPEQWTWDWHTALIVPNQVWSFVALVVEPDKATVYLDDGTLQAATNRTTHYKELFNGPTHFGEQMQYPDRFFKGVMDDVRIYDRSLSPGEILYLSQGASSSQYVTLPPWRPDANSDDRIDLKDYAVMANNWLKEILWP